MIDTIERRMISNTNYEVRQAIHIGDCEILIAEDMNDPDGNCYLIADYRENGILGEYSRCQVSGDYLEIMQEFTVRLNRQIEAVNAEIGIADFQSEIITAEQCYPNDYKQDITGTVVAIKASAMRPEYRRGDVQLVFVTHGNGAKANPMGRGVYCFHLTDGKQTRFERQDVQGKVKELPVWAKERLAILQAERAPQKVPAPERVAGYTITERVQVDKMLFVLGENPSAVTPFVTWQRFEGRTGYDHGHYFNSRDKALADLHTRANGERENNSQSQTRQPKSRNDAR